MADDHLHGLYRHALVSFPWNAAGGPALQLLCRARSVARECCCPHRSSVCPGPSFGSRGTHVMGLGSNPAVALPPGRFLKRRDHRDRGHFHLHRLSATAQCLSLSRTCLRAHFESGIEPISCHAWSHALILGAFDPFSVRAVRSACLWLTFQSSVPSDCGRSVICA